MVSAELRRSEPTRAHASTHAFTVNVYAHEAKGILMERERITADLAFEVLRRASQRMNVRLRSVAETLIATGESPAGSGHSGDGRG